MSRWHVSVGDVSAHLFDPNNMRVCILRKHQGDSIEQFNAIATKIVDALNAQLPEEPAKPSIDEALGAE
jgi:hypothetical protein